MKTQDKVFVFGSNLYGQSVVASGKPPPSRVAPVMSELIEEQGNDNVLTPQPLMITTECPSFGTTDPVIDVACGGNFTVFLTQSRRVYGIGDSAHDNFSMVRVDTACLREIEALRDKKVKRVFCGFNFTYFWTENDEIYRAGSNGYAQLSLTESEEAAVGRYLEAPLDPKLYNNEKVKEISLGGSFTYLLTHANNLYRCGQNGNNQLVHQDSQLSKFTLLENIHSVEIDRISCGAYHIVVMTKTKQLYGSGQLFQENSNTTWFTEIDFPTHVPLKDIIAGYNYWMAITKTGELYGCAANLQTNDGQLGSTKQEGNYLVSTIPGGVKKVITSCSSTTTLVITMDRNLYGCGCNERGGLGIDSTTNIPEFMLLKELSGKHRSCEMGAGTGAFHTTVFFYSTTVQWVDKLWKVCTSKKFVDVEILTTDSST